MCSSLMIPAATFSIMKCTRIMKCLTFFRTRAARECRGQRDEAHVVHPQSGRLQLWVSELGEKIPKEHDVPRGIESGADFGFR